MIPSLDLFDYEIVAAVHVVWQPVDTVRLSSASVLYVLQKRMLFYFFWYMLLFLININVWYVQIFSLPVIGIYGNTVVDQETKDALNDHVSN